MPSIDEHIEISRLRTGREYRELHEWMDSDPTMKESRHDVNKICEYGQLMKAKYGTEGVEEYVQHISDDLMARFLIGKSDVDPAITAQIALEELRSPPRAIEDDVCRVKASDVDLLREAGVSEEDIAHSIQGAQKALEIAERIHASLDMMLLSRGALLRDLGKAKSRGDDHGILGAQIGKQLGLPEAITNIMEKHVRAGLTEEEARQLELPARDYTPNALEEKIIIYADKLADIVAASEKIVSTEREAEERFSEILKTHPELARSEMALKRHIKYHEEIQRLMKDR